MSEFTDMGGGYGSQTTEIYLKRVLTGNIESVRSRLSAALERLGYDVVEEEPALHGRRGAKGWGTWYASADVLDYAMTLIIRLKPLGAHSTRATFDYIIKHPYLSRGEKEVLTREAEAITALATVRAADKICAACGTESTDDSRFCRRCGAPMTSEHAEIKVLQMTAEARAGHTSVVTSAIMLMVTSIIALITLIIAGTGAMSAKGAWTLAIIGGIIGFLNLLVTLFAWNRLNRALKPKRKEQHVALNVTAEQAITANEPVALPPTAARASITEGTTELLDARRQPERVPIYREDRDTGAMH